MQELRECEVALVGGGNGMGQVQSCVSGGSLGARVGMAFGAWGGVAGAAAGCGLGLILYNS